MLCPSFVLSVHIIWKHRLFGERCPQILRLMILLSVLGLIQLTFITVSTRKAYQQTSAPIFPGGRTFSLVFARNMEEELAEEMYFFFISLSWWCLVCGYDGGLNSNKPTYYVIYYADYVHRRPQSIFFFVWKGAPSPLSHLCSFCRRSATVYSQNPIIGHYNPSIIPLPSHTTSIN